MVHTFDSRHLESMTVLFWLGNLATPSRELGGVICEATGR